MGTFDWELDICKQECYKYSWYWFLDINKCHVFKNRSYPRGRRYSLNVKWC